MKNKTVLFSCVCALICLLSASEEVISCGRDSLKICLELIIPGLFPFFIITGLLNLLGLPYYFSLLAGKLPEKLFGVSAAGFSCFPAGIFGGYPLGAACISQNLQNNIIGEDEAERLLSFCNNSGPGFIIGAVGAGALGSPGLGLLLYLVHIASALITGLLLRGRIQYSAPAPAFRPLPFSSAFCEAVKSGVINILNVCGFVLCFGIFTGLLEAGGFISAAGRLLPFDLKFTEILIKGLLEPGSAAAAMRGMEICPGSLALISFLLSFGGLSVHFQTLSLFSDKNISSRPYFKGCCLKAVSAYVLTYGLAALFRI